MVTWSQMGMLEKFYDDSECYILTLGHTATHLDLSCSSPEEKIRIEEPPLTHNYILFLLSTNTFHCVTLMWDKIWTWTHGHMVTDEHVRKII